MSNGLVINTHTHMQRFEVDFPRKLGEFYVNMFRGQDCWHTGKPWKPEDFCVPGERLVADMDGAGIDKAFVLGVGYVPWDAYDPENGAYVQSLVQRWPDRLYGFFTANPADQSSSVFFAVLILSASLIWPRRYSVAFSSCRSLNSFGFLLPPPLGCTP